MSNEELERDLKSLEEVVIHLFKRLNKIEGLPIDYKEFLKVRKELKDSKITTGNNNMKFRRHHNNKGYRRIKSGTLKKETNLLIKKLIKGKIMKDENNLGGERNETT